MFMAAVFTVAKRGRAPKGPLTDEWINFVYIHICIYGSVCNGRFFSFRNGGDSDTGTTWMSLEDMLLREMSQSQRERYRRSPSYEVLRVAKGIEREGRVVVAKGWGRGTEWGGRNGDRVSVTQGEKSSMRGQWR